MNTINEEQYDTRSAFATSSANLANTGSLTNIDLKTVDIFSEYGADQLFVKVEKEQFQKTSKCLQLKANNQSLKSAIESANILAHSLKSPLSAIKLLSNKKGISLSDRNLLNMSFNRMVDIIKDIQLLDNANHLSYAQEKVVPTNMKSLMTELSDCIGQLYKEEKNIEFKFKPIPANIICKIPNKSFNDAIYNIVKNAFEAVEHKGCVTLTANIDSDHLNLIVSDTGCGMPKHLIDNIGKKYLSFGKKNGTGIGLFQVKKMLDKCNGQININSSHLGTDVTLKIPIATTD